MWLILRGPQNGNKNNNNKLKSLSRSSQEIQ